MACEDHQVLANNIKTVHMDLRKRMLRGENIEDIWKSHLENVDILDQYAKSMEKLATNYWLNEENSRVSWIFRQIENYFWSGGISCEYVKDVQLAKKKGEVVEVTGDVVVPEKVKVLDVGSCYNPFNAFCDKLGKIATLLSPELYSNIFRYSSN